MRFSRCFVALLMFACATLPALAGTYVSSPTNGSQVSSPFTLTVSSDTCSSQPVAHIGFSMDDSTYTFIYAGTTMNGPVTSGTGWHMVHVKTWNNAGGVCVSDVAINVVAPSGAASASMVPSNAVAINNIQSQGNWIQIHDGGTPGSSSGWTGTQGSPSMTGSAREFATNFYNFAGQRYSVVFDTDGSSTNFVYDTWVYIAGSSSGFKNLEFDLNQTMTNGETVIMGFQCDTWNHTWDYAVNGGSPTKPWDTWNHSSAYCNAQEWSVNQWHHVQIYSAHDSNGWVTYHSVWLDGVQEPINATVFSGFDLGWGPAIVANFQIDGSTSGSTYAQVYMDKMNVYRW